MTVQASGCLIVEQNTLQAGQGPRAWHAAILALPEGTEVGAGSTVETTSGAWSHRARTGARHLYDAAHKVASAVKRHVIGRLYRW